MAKLIVCLVFLNCLIVTLSSYVGPYSTNHLTRGNYAEIEVKPLPFFNRILKIRGGSSKATKKSSSSSKKKSMSKRL